MRRIGALVVIAAVAGTGLAFVDFVEGDPCFGGVEGGSITYTTGGWPPQQRCDYEPGGRVVAGPSVPGTLAAIAALAMLLLAAPRSAVVRGAAVAAAGTGVVIAAWVYLPVIVAFYGGPLVALLGAWRVERRAQHTLRALAGATVVTVGLFLYWGL